MLDRACIGAILIGSKAADAIEALLNVCKKMFCTKDGIDQVGITVLTGLYIFLFGQGHPWATAIVGFCSEPFWLHFSWTKRHWGVFATTLWFTINFAIGIWHYWPRELAVTASSAGAWLIVLFQH